MGLFSKNDWIIVWNDVTEWNVVNEMGKPAEGSNLHAIKQAYYIIEYSDSRDEYRLRTSGYKADEHRMYATAMRKLSDFQTGGLRETIRKDVVEDVLGLLRKWSSDKESIAKAHAKDIIKYIKTH